MFTCVYTTRITGTSLQPKTVRILVLVPPDVVLLPVFCVVHRQPFDPALHLFQLGVFTFEYHRWWKLTAVHHHHLSFFLFKLVPNASEHFTYYVFKFLFHVQAGRPSLSQILNQ